MILTISSSAVLLGYQVDVVCAMILVGDISNIFLKTLLFLPVGLEHCVIRLANISAFSVFLFSFHV